MSLLNAAERFASIDRSQMVLDVKSCLHSQDQYSECAACFNLCPVNAITAGNPPSLHTEVCQACLACIPACPVGAYRADDDVSNLLNCAVHVEDQPVELLCGLHSQAEKGLESGAIGIRIRGCLAGLGTGAYLALSTLALTRITARTDVCHSCKWQTLDPEIRRQVERANRFLTAWGKADTITCADEVEAPTERVLWDATNPPLSRRDLFRMLSRQGQVAMARAMANGATTATRQPGRDRMRLLSSISHLPSVEAAVPGGGDADMNHYVDGFNFATIAISESCTACGACAKACPTEALKFVKNEEQLGYSIFFTVQKCIGCDLCDHVCQPDAITINHAPTFEQVFGVKEPVVAATGPMVRCERCKTLTAAREGGSLCPLCEYRRSHPFGSMMPKKITRESRS